MTSFLTRLRCRIVFTFCIMAIMSGGVWAQGVPPKTPGGGYPTSFQEFDIFSVKPSQEGAAVTDINADALAYYGKNVSLKMLISAAYGTRDGKIFGLPKWAEDSKWDVQAKVSNPDPVRLKMVPSQTDALKIYRIHALSILTTRFGLRAHTEERTSDVYHLEARNGIPKLNKSTTLEADQGIFGSFGKIDGRGITLEDLCKELSGYVGRDVIDDTHLRGKYDVRLSWQPDQAPAPAFTGDQSSLPDIFGALAEQLNLKLSPGKGPSEVLFVDSIERPSPN